ncbi:unnamed protein product [Mytilus edulis]|uniref:Uncharacterized protein n=1 Tax=Mytilus edulis TaxID=6550 RepID=A0A8S3U6X6_MYTED|nr:unnamed protein product [Mytilus edulis]
MNEHHNLPRTSTEANLNDNKLDHGPTTEKPCQTKEAFKKDKQHPKLFKLMQVMKNVKKGLTKKTKTIMSRRVKSVEALKLRERQRSKLCIDQVNTSRSSVRGSLTRVTDISTFINDFTTSNISDLSITPADREVTCSHSCMEQNLTEMCSRNRYNKCPVRRMLQFGASHHQKKTQSNCYSRFKTEPIANSTMVDDLDNTVIACSLSCKSTEFAPSVQSTMLHEWLPCASSTIMKSKIQQFDESTCNSVTDVETWSINEGEETCVLHENYLGRHQYEKEYMCHSRDFLSTIAASTICRDEFSLDGCHQQEQFIMDRHRNLPRTSTETHLNNNKLDHGPASENHVKRKRTTSNTNNTQNFSNYCKS